MRTGGKTKGHPDPAYESRAFSHGGRPRGRQALSPQDSPPGTGMQGEQIRWRE